MTVRHVAAVGAALVLCSCGIEAHEISGANASFVSATAGPAIVPFMYLGAKHMITGVDHVLFLLGVVFFLRRLRSVVLYVSLFTAGHSITLLAGVLGGWQVNAHLVDAVIGFSVMYKAFENLGGFESTLHARPDMRIAVFVFGLCHGLGLATKLQALAPSKDGLLTNLVSFNVGVELGQILVLACAVAVLDAWRRRGSFVRHAFATNTVLFACGVLLAGHQLTGYLVTS